jgi:L-alanine-DL-glutamate epimerase-like enolase superfamily enzyme
MPTGMIARLVGERGFGFIRDEKSERPELFSLRTAGEYLVGKDPFQIELHWENLYRHGINTAAISGVETALWDIVGETHLWSRH